MEGITTPLYDQNFRINLRDGVWYEGDVLGNIPLAWDETTQTWVPSYPPSDWIPSNFYQVGSATGPGQGSQQGPLVP